MDLVTTRQTSDAVQLGCRTEHCVRLWAQREHGGTDTTPPGRRFVGASVREIDRPRECPPSADGQHVVDVVPAEPPTQRLRPSDQTILNGGDMAKPVCAFHEAKLPAHPAAPPPLWTTLWTATPTTPVIMTLAGLI
ncbi:hypothetical protein ACFQGL_21955 [Micromonospora vulcania]|uniref:Uncharacterized protein n=1 Tax=Micromonospora vulcania TaxID=1441873 RepID=A0ABW1HBV6_9ACTN